jgi:hypothetical protein
MKVELAVMEGLLESVDELAAKDFAQYLLGKKVVVSRANPAGVIGRKAAGRNDTVNVGMNFEFLAPGMQHTEKANLCAEMFRIACHFAKSFGTGAEQEIDNNGAERSLRSIVVGRNNWLFYGSDKGGRTGAVLSSLIASCKRLRVEPFGYLRDLFARISTHPISHLDELLPDKWLVAQRKVSLAHEET